MKPHKFVIGLLAWASCSIPNERQVPRSVAISVVEDMTDSFLLRPEPNPILKLYDFPRYPEQAALFRYVQITDMQLNSSQQLEIQDGVTTEKENRNDDIIYRENLVAAFYNDVRDVLKKGTASSSFEPLGYSECYATIANELRLLSRSAAQRRILIIFSDLFENNPVFSCYSANGKNLLNCNPEQVVEILQKSVPLPADLTGINVFFVFKPKNRDEERTYLAMIKVYRQILEPKGATIIVQPDNTTFSYER